VIGLGRVYLLNSLITPIDFDRFANAKVIFRRVDVETARRILSGGFISAVGHEATSRLLSKILGMHVPLSRNPIFMEKGDKAVHFFLKQRLPEGAVLDEVELAELEYWLILSELEEVEQASSGE